jgi:hypothetical protein
VLEYCSLGQMSSFRLPGEHPHGLLVYVSPDSPKQLQLGALAVSIHTIAHNATRCSGQLITRLLQVYNPC